MIKKKLLIGLASILTAGAFAGAISAGYLTNNYSNSAYQYASVPTGASTTELIQSYFSAAVNGSKLLYLASYTHTTPLNDGLNTSVNDNAALNKYLGQTGYILIDDQFGLPTYDNENLFSLSVNQPIWSTNVSAVQFRADLGSFITGVALGEFLNENKDYFYNDGKLTWSTYGALPYSSVSSFMGGMQKGVEWFNENIVPKASDKGYVEVEQVFLGSNESQNFAGSFDVSAGNNLVNEFLSKGVDAIFPVAGAQIAQVVRLIKQSNKRTIVIGVDSAVEANTSTNLNLPTSDTNIGYKNKIVQFSSIKNIESMVNKITKIINGDVSDTETSTNDWTDIGGIGYSSLGTVKNGGVGVSDAGKPYFIKAMNIFSNITSDTDFDNITDEELDTLYNSAAITISSQQTVIDMDNNENKTYSIPNYLSTISYSSIVNNGFNMLPIAGTDQEIETWYETQYANDETMLNLKSQNLALIKQWIENNASVIATRKDLKDSLVGKFDREDWETYHGIIKIMFQSPTNILFDSSFLESCYYGLREYWASKNVELPSPPSLEN